MTTILYLKNESTQKQTSGVKMINKKEPVDFVPELLGVFSLHIIHGHRFYKRTNPWQISGKMYACLNNLLTLSVANIKVALKPHRFRYWDESLWVGKNHALQFCLVIGFGNQYFPQKYRLINQENYWSSYSYFWHTSVSFIKFVFIPIVHLSLK